jgi:pyrroloquinoline-quinone synthase
MNLQTFWAQIQGRIGQHDLLCHPFYKAWAAGELSAADLREYAADYYHHVAAFPTYLSALHARLEDGELRRRVLRNLCDEEGIESPDTQPHSELWLDFAEGMGADREEVRRREPAPEVEQLIRTFRRMAGEEPVIAALAAFYAYECQVPRVAKEKAKGLREFYEADRKTCAYFDLHTMADIYHAQVWRDELENLVAQHPEQAERALQAAEECAQALWKALDGIERGRLARRAGASAAD